MTSDEDDRYRDTDGGSTLYRSLDELDRNDRGFVERLGRELRIGADEALRWMGVNSHGPKFAHGRFAHVRLGRYEKAPPGPWNLKLVGLDRLEALQIDESCSPIRRLDLRGATSLRDLNLSHCEVAEIITDDSVPLERLRISDNPTRRAFWPAREIGAGMANLRSLELWSCPAISFDRRAAPRLVHLCLDNMSLSTIDVSPCRELRYLELPSNGLRDIDLSGSPALELVDLRFNAIESIDVSRLARLRKLNLDGNKVRALDLRSVDAIQELSLWSNPLGRLDLGSLRKLTDLHVGETEVAALDLADAYVLRAVGVDGSRIEKLDLRHLSRLDWLDAGSAQVKLLESQRRLIDARITGNSETTWPWASVRLALPWPFALDAYQLERMARSTDWDFAFATPGIVRHPSCDLATALFLYWHSSAGFFAQYRDEADARRDGAENAETFALLLEIEDRVANGRFRIRELPYAPHSDEGVDYTRLYDDQPRARTIPECMFQATGEHGKDVPPALPTRGGLR